jgi:hypothetical protein
MSSAQLTQTSESMASNRQPSSVLAVRYKQCDHMNAKSVTTTIPDKFDLNQLFFEHHEGSFDKKNYEFKAVCRTGIDQKAQEFEADKSIP